MTDEEPQTRTFFHTDRDEEAWVELTWFGHRVEIGTTADGSDWSVEYRQFESLEARDEFLDAYIESLLDDGYSEPESPPDGASADEDPAERFAREHRRPAWMPELVEGEGAPADSRFGGRPWMPASADWPDCGNCGDPMDFLLQLAVDSFPEELRARLDMNDGSALVQWFRCNRICQADGGWKPFASSARFRTVSSAQEGDVRGAPAGAPPHDARRVADWNRARDYPSWQEDERTTGEFEPSIAETMAIREETPLAGDKLGGWPHWIQAPQYPDCPDCGAGMEPWFQVDSRGAVGAGFGDSGIAWLARCPGCGRSTSFWQSH